MKKYTNTSDRMMCVEFEGTAQFLSRGQSITNDLITIRVPDGILVEDLPVREDKIDTGENPTEPEVKTKFVSKKKSKTKSE